jgi:hypothetical protein
VLCTYCYVFQMHFYKYYAALPLCIAPKDIKHHYIYCDVIVQETKKCGHHNICSEVIVQEAKRCGHHNICSEVIVQETKRCGAPLPAGRHVFVDCRFVLRPKVLSTIIFTVT